MNGFKILTDNGVIECDFIVVMRFTQELQVVQGLLHGLLHVLRAFPSLLRKLMLGPTYVQFFIILVRDGPSLNSFLISLKSWKDLLPHKITLSDFYSYTFFQVSCNICH